MRRLKFLFWICVFLFNSGFLGFCSPMAVIKADKTSGTAPLTVNFDASKSLAFNNAISGYQWDFDSDGTIDSEGVTATHTYYTSGSFTAKLIVRDIKGNESVATKTITIASPISLNIISPAPGEYFVKPKIILRGTVSNANGTETGVTVNELPVDVFANSFATDRVVLQEGENTITVKATDAQGCTAEATIKVNLTAAQKYISLKSDTISGISPFEARLSLAGTFDYLNPGITYTTPAGGTAEIIEIQGNIYKVRMTGAGQYAFTVIAYDDGGTVYLDTVYFTVMDKPAFETLLNTKWNSMRQALVQDNVESAVKDFSSKTKDDYRQALNALTIEQRSELAQTLSNARFVRLRGNIAEYSIRTTIESKEFSFYLAFEKDESGLWKIRSF
jgi:PKD repeat protein